ncbi:PLC-like phosphodiesterase, TIM beta/alpha-barrel domain [Pseudocohnilembus persalinus]|uniref:Phosphoinositide phospholipase C n=1 Tax=Pseudocohnilembus persalinus TaxID=266149 RepID=A0A0V0QX79_PSEPJ|nr:PLC-like phosphodiesterase, TIM beta/alpha-barrel domain [Pseudocohnilembus persalinus]|eukprot:KRX06806.1 PLC-like phosphodiesterase, TIM beta/alpha-barrel domain [Pseudocohnilembus persalinus]
MQYVDKNERERKKNINLSKNNLEFPLELEASPLIAKKLKKKAINLKFTERKFEEYAQQSEDFRAQSELLLRYGCKCQLFFQRKFVLSNKQFTNCYISVSDEANDQLVLVDIQENKAELIDIFKVGMLQGGRSWNISKQKQTKISDDKELWLSVYYEKSKMGIMLQFEKKETRDMMWCGFQELVQYHKKKKQNREENSTYDEVISELKSNQDEQMFNFKDTKDIISRLQLKISRKYLESIYKNISQNEKKQKQKENEIQKISKRQLEKFIKTLVTHPEIYPIFEFYNGQTVRDLDQYTMNIDQFKHFLKTEQFENWNQKELQSVFTFLSTENYSDKLSFIGFGRLIFSKKNTLFDPNKCKYPQDMDQPITNYYINSAKNIYSCNLDLGAYYHFPEASGSEYEEEWEDKYKPIFFALQKGVKFFEIEIWDGDKNGPVIQYGHCMTSKLYLSEMVAKLMKHVFTNNPYPFWLSIETHCSEQQNEMAIQILKNIIGNNNLFILPKNYQDELKYRSPNSLKYKIILTGTIASWTIDDTHELQQKNVVLDNIDNEMQVMEQQDQQLAKQKKKNIQLFLSQKKNLQKPKLKQYLEDKNATNKQENMSLNSDDEDKKGSVYENEEINQQKLISQQQQAIKQKQQQQQKNSIVKDLSGYKLTSGLQQIYGFYTHSIKGQENPSLYEIYEIKLSHLHDYLESGGDPQLLQDTVAKKHEDLIQFTKQFLLKVRPNGKKIDSNNFNPVMGFKVGAQFIISHPQTFDVSSLVYQAKFQENNGIGYVLKPPEFRDSNSSMQRSQKINVILKVVSGYQLRTLKQESVNPQVEVLVIQPSQRDSLMFQTKIVEENNFNPLWKSNNAWKFQVEQPDISFLVFQAISVGKGQKHLLGWFAMPCNALRQGYRVVPLRDEHFCTIQNSYLLIHSEVSPRQL